jgi:translocation and assembly module TamB
VTRRRLATFVALLLILVPAAGAWWVLSTQSGGARLLDTARNVTGGALSYDTASGSIAGGLTLSELRFETEGVIVEIGLLYAEAQPTLVPLGVRVENARAESLSIQLVDTGEPPAEEFDLASLLEALRLPMALSVDSLVATDVNVRSDAANLAHAESIAVSLAWQDSIELTAFEVDGGEGYGLSGSAALGLSRPFDVNAEIDARAGNAVTRLPEELSASLTLAGTLDRLDLELSEATTELRLQARLDDLTREPAWDATASLPGLALNDQILLENVETTSTGTLQHFRLAVDGSVAGLIDAAPARVSGRASGSAEGFDVEALAIEHPAVQGASSGRLDFPLRYRGEVVLETLALDYWAASLAEPHRVSGSADVAATAERLSIEAGHFELAGTDADVDIAGAIDLATGTLDAQVAWRELRWPLMSAAAQVESREGRATVSGTLDDWRTEVSAALAAPNIAEGKLVATGAGTRTSAAVDIVEGEVFGGSVAGTAILDWVDELQWSGEASATGLRTGVLLPSYPGILTLQVKGDGTNGGGQIELVDLSGTLLDEPVEGSGKLAYYPGSLQAHEFRVTHGDAAISLDGELYAGEGLDFTARVPDLALYRPAFSGDFMIDGRLSLNPDAPALALIANSGELRFGELVMTGLDIQTTETDARGVNLAMDAEALMLGERRIDTIDVDAELNPERQRVSIRMVPLGSPVTIVAEGAMREPGSLTGFPWVGELVELRLVTPEGEGGGLDTPAQLELSPDRLLVDDLCLSGDLRGSLCASFDYDEASGVRFESTLDGVPIDVLNAFIQTGFKFEQTVSGQLTFDRQTDAGTTGRADVRFSAGKIASVRFPELDLQTGDGGVSFDMADGQLLAGQVDIPLGPRGFVEGTFKVADMTLGADSPIAGSFRAQTSDIDVLMVPVPDLDGVEGQLQADLEFTGSLGQPSAVGSATLKNGRLSYFPLGLALTDIDLAGRFDESQHLDLNGTFRAGDGTGEITTRTNRGEAGLAGIHIGVRGTGLKVVELPDISAVADTDLKLDYRSGRIDIDGSIDFPSARIRPVNLVTSRVDESEDVIIVAGSLPDEPEPEENAAGPDIYGKLAVGIGDDVQVILDVARATVTGSADFEWSGEPVPTGRGRYNVNGTVEAFGQVLDISEGRVSFPGVPATEPILDIRATRDIFGNTQVKQAGVLVQGAINRPTIKAYTVPITTEERALTLLVTGNDFDYEQGVGAIDFGTYIAPRLFLSYGVGVFDRENIVTARYDLTTGFGIRATSGSRASGVDLTYRLER